MTLSLEKDHKMNQSHQVVESTNKQEIAAHLKRLSKDDRYLRFCATLTDEAIDKYVFEIIDFSSTKHKAFVVLEENQIVGLCNVGRLNESILEFAFSVDEKKRHNGIADALFQAAVAYAHEIDCKVIKMDCLATNQAIKKLALRHGMKITSERGESTGLINV